MRSLDELETTANPRLHNLLYRKRIAASEGLCTYCPPHHGENTRNGSYYKKYRVKKEFQLRRRGKLQTKA